MPKNKKTRMRRVPGREARSISGGPHPLDFDLGGFSVHDPEGLAKLIAREVEDQSDLTLIVKRQESYLCEAGIEAWEGQLLSLDWGQWPPKHCRGRVHKPSPDRIEGKSEVMARLSEEIGFTRTTLLKISGQTFTRDGERIFFLTMTWAVYRLLQAWIRPDRRDALDRVALSPDTRRRRREYLAYLEREVGRLRARRTAKHDLAYDIDPAVQDEVEAFRQFVQRKGLPHGRVQLGQLRVFDPIIGWRRLRNALTADDSRDALVRLVKQGYLRERELVKAEVREVGPGVK